MDPLQNKDSQSTDLLTNVRKAQGSLRTLSGQSQPVTNRQPLSSHQAVAQTVRSRCAGMTNVPRTESADRRLQWSQATLRIHTERDGQCSYCSERGSADPWPCLMARMAMHAKSAATPHTR